MIITIQSFRFFGNRSYCYYCLEQYPPALADAERAIQLAPDWPKGYFRKGSALMGMKVGTACCGHVIHQETSTVCICLIKQNFLLPDKEMLLHIFLTLLDFFLNDQRSLPF